MLGRGLDGWVTSGDTASIFPAKVDADWGHLAQEAVGLLLLLEVPSGMLETGCPTGPLGWSLRCLVTTHMATITSS